MRTIYKFTSIIFAFFVLFQLGLCDLSASTYDLYIWETPQITGISTSSDTIKAQVQSEVEKILKSGHLAPLRVSGSDQLAEGYYMYTEPGRIIQTLAMAYPYVSSTTKNDIKNYVKNELSNPSYTIWSNSSLHPNTGTKREYYSMTQNWQWDWWWGQDGQYRPRASVLYGLWLYAYYTNDWTVVTNNWTSIKSFYNTYSGQGNMYGTMSIHIAMARMAHKMNDGPVMQTAVTNADRAFQNGLLFSTAETAAKSYYRNQYTYFPERRRYHGWVFLNLVPEVARYINDNEPLKNEVLLRHQLGISTFSKWYVPRAWYENGISGHESSGIPSEIIGMMFPVERWIVKTPSTQLIEWRNALPASIGDSYVIEASILAIESTGTTIWVDSRDPYTSPSNTPRMKLGDGNADSKVDGIDYIIWLNHYNQLITGSINGDFNDDGKVDGIDYIKWLTNYGL